MIKELTEEELEEFIARYSDKLENNDFDAIFDDVSYDELTFIVKTLDNAGVEYLPYLNKLYDCMYYGRDDLRNFTIPSNVMEIEQNAFYYCTSLTDIKYDGTEEQWNTINKSKYWKGNSAIKKIRCSDGDIILK